MNRIENESDEAAAADAAVREANPANRRSCPSKLDGGLDAVALARPNHLRDAWICQDGISRSALAESRRSGEVS